MKTIIRKSNERLQTQISWLKSFHTFSFGEHYDPNWMGFKNLRVINDDYLEPNQGFPFHPHKNMEIVTFMLNGKLLHQDSLGNKSTIEPGELQVMSAGKGIIHSEFSKSETGRVHLLQIWIEPNQQNLNPRYEQKQILNNSENNFLKVIAGQDINHFPDAMLLNANSFIWQGSYNENFEIEFSPHLYKNLWIHVFQGDIQISNTSLFSGDAIAFSDLNQNIIIKNASNNPVGFLIFELE
jgi:redox-sensitive bicupin YhaK (pirin superfamily)